MTAEAHRAWQRRNDRRELVNKLFFWGAVLLVIAFAFAIKADAQDIQGPTSWKNGRWQVTPQEDEPTILRPPAPSPPPLPPRVEPVPNLGIWEYLRAELSIGKKGYDVFEPVTYPLRPPRPSPPSAPRKWAFAFFGGWEYGAKIRAVYETDRGTVFYLAPAPRESSIMAVRRWDGSCYGVRDGRPVLPFRASGEEEDPTPPRVAPLPPDEGIGRSKGATRYW